MTTTDLLSLVHNAGIILRAEGDRLVYEAPSGTLTPDLRAALVQHKPELLELLSPRTRYVCLRAGLVVPKAALELALGLEARGFRLSIDDAAQIAIEPTGTSGPLSDADRCAVARWRWHLGAIAAYASEVPQ